MTNPLLEETDLPRFSAICPEHVVPAITRRIEENRQAIAEALKQTDPTWDNLVAYLDDYDDRLSRSWSPVSHLNSVMDSPELRQAYNECLPLLSAFSSEVSQNEKLFEAYQKIRHSEAYESFTQAQKKTIENALRDFHLGGVDLPEDKKARYREIKQKLSELTTRFSENVLDATQGWEKWVSDRSELAGLPESALEAASELAARKGRSGWLFTLDFPSYYPVITYCENRALREEMYRAYVTRASDQGPNAGKWDNSAIMDEILALRHELAGLLGFANYAELSLATKMAESPQEVMEFLLELAEKSRPIAEQELAELKAFAREEYGVETLEAWDIPWYSEKLKQQRYRISDEELRPYFPADKVIAGLFEVANRLFAIRFSEDETVDRWHPDVRFYRVMDASGEPIAGFYLDLYAREHKRGGAWMDECVVRRETPAGVQLPIAYLTCNFNRPVGDKPALLTHDEVTTLFHEFGHGLHHMLTRIGVSAVSGINGVAWDAVELPSQFLENWCWEPEALAVISGHYETGEPLPRHLLDNMLAARNFQSAMMMVRQLEFSLFDMRIHAEYQPGMNIQQVLDETRQQVAVLIPPSFNRFQHGFSHIFAGGYAAGYYSYKWAEVLSADAFSRFEEEGIFNARTGADFRHAILEQGGADDAMNLFVAFRGRKPAIEPLLRHSGILPVEASRP